MPAQCHDGWIVTPDRELPLGGAMSDDTSPTVHHVDDVYLWLEQGLSIHIKAVTQFGDPVELSSHHARQLAIRLTDLADQADQ